MFSNCGAGDVGYKNAGFDFKVMAELDSRRLEVCKLNHPGAIGVAGDVRKTWREIVNAYREVAGEQAPALLCACPPCQGMSSARSGKGRHADAAAGSKDARNLLITVVAKVAKELLPKIIVVENVPAFFSRKVYHPKDKKGVSAANYLISELAKDYEIFPLIADLSIFGIPQSRNRAFLTLVRKSVDAVSVMLAAGEAPFPVVTHADSPITLADALKGFALPPLDAGDEKRAAVDGYNGLHVVPIWNERIYEMVAAIPAGTGRSAWNNDVCLACGVTNSALESVYCSACSALLPKPTIKDEEGGYRLIKGFKSSYRRMHLNRPAATVTTASGHVGSDYTIHPTENRLLSPLECALLQTFPSDFKWGTSLTDVGYTHVREMIGEAVPPAFTELHGAILMSLLRSGKRVAKLKIDDPRMLQAWDKLEVAAAIDGRRTPKRYASYLSQANSKEKSEAASRAVGIQKNKQAKRKGKDVSSLALPNR